VAKARYLVEAHLVEGRAVKELAASMTPVVKVSTSSALVRGCLSESVFTY
jgi:hypothetical protein